MDRAAGPADEPIRVAVSQELGGVRPRRTVQARAARLPGTGYLGPVGQLAEHEGLQAAARRLGATGAQVALAWLLRRSPVVVPIPGTSSVEHLRSNVAAGALAQRLTDDEVTKHCTTSSSAPRACEPCRRRTRSSAEQRAKAGAVPARLRRAVRADVCSAMMASRRRRP